MALLRLAASANIQPMPDLTERYEHYLSRLRAAIDARNLTNEEIAGRLGVHVVTVSERRSGARPLTDVWRARFAEALQLDEEVLFGADPMPPPRPEEIFRPKKMRGRKPKVPANSNGIPLFGLAAGSLAGAHSVSAEPVDTVPCPPALADVIGAYALRTRGESMIPRYMPGDLLYVHPHQKKSPGDHVVIQTQRYDGAGTETWIKRYDGERDGNIFAWQYNPPARVDFSRDTVIYVHRVLPVNELFGSN